MADQGVGRPDFVLGDRFGTSCSPDLIRLAGGQLKALGHVVVLNKPYAGGYITEHYGRPHEGIHALQVEINRALYMDEASFEKSPGVRPPESRSRAHGAGHRHRRLRGLAIPRAAAE